MKNFIILLNLILILWITSIFSVETVENEKGSEEKELPAPKTQLASGLSLEVEKTNRYADSAPNPFLVKDISDFILEISEARIMNIEEGKIAEQQGTSRALKDYGTMMVNDQSKMLDELKKMAATKKIIVRNFLGESKSEGLKKLKEANGRDFDDKFIRMMIIDHKRDVKKFEKALYSTDPDIQVFATKYLPLIKDHLNKIKSIKNDS